ncbi:MAG: DUF58 domain-containing protein [Nitrosopumilaceae archaeon]|nr:DUF58 domain-containing protein [Nitrosopumilaceae archaeon]
MPQSNEFLKKIKNLEIKTRHLVDGIITGNYDSIFKGQGIEFSEIRDYRIGDDIRAIDWKVTARFNQPYIKEFIEERDLQVYFVIDVSGSGNFGSNISKKEKSLEIIASLMFAALRNNDEIGVFLISEGIEKFIPAKKGKRHVLQILNFISNYKPKSLKTNLQNCLEYVSKTIKRKSVVFLVSDFNDETNFFKPLKILRKNNDVVALKLTDPREQVIPDVGLIELEDQETGEQILVDTSDENFREKYSKLISDKNSQFFSEMKRQKIDAVSLTTEEDFSIPIRKLFKRR